MQSWFWKKYLVSGNKQEWLDAWIDAWIEKGRKWHYMIFLLTKVSWYNLTLLAKQTFDHVICMTITSKESHIDDKSIKNSKGCLFVVATFIWLALETFFHYLYTFLATIWPTQSKVHIFNFIWYFLKTL